MGVAQGCAPNSPVRVSKWGPTTITWFLSFWPIIWFSINSALIGFWKHFQSLHLLYPDVGGFSRFKFLTDGSMIFTTIQSKYIKTAALVQRPIHAAIDGGSVAPRVPPPNRWTHEGGHTCQTIRALVRCCPISIVVSGRIAAMLTLIRALVITFLHAPSHAVNPRITHTHVVLANQTTFAVAPCAHRTTLAQVRDDAVSAEIRTSLVASDTGIRKTSGADAIIYNTRRVFEIQLVIVRRSMAVLESVQLNTAQLRTADWIGGGARLARRNIGIDFRGVVGIDHRRPAVIPILPALQKCTIISRKMHDNATQRK